MSLPKASEEQKTAIKSLSTNNTVIESVAGSGKTTTILYISKVFELMNPNHKILLLTYNAKLKLETRERVADLGIKNLEVHSYHSFCVRHISGECSTDRGIIRNLNNTHDGFEDMVRPLPEYDVIIIDEAQDMTFLYYEIVVRIMEGSPLARICVVGDKYQSIYGYNGSDSRFITCAESIFSKAVWSRINLSTSYRINNQMAVFVRDCLGRQITAAKNGAKPRYLFQGADFDVLREVQRYLLEYSAEDIFILAPSVRGSSKSPISRISNSLSRCGYQVYMPSDDSRSLDEDILRGKLVFSTFHQAKGLERKCVIVLGFDATYYKYYNREADRTQCPNELYVAITRASERLTLVHGTRQEFLPFLNIKSLYTTCDVVGKYNAKASKKRNTSTTSVTDLLRHVSAQTMELLMALVRVEVVNTPCAEIDIPTKQRYENPLGDVFYEEVADITGVAVPTYYQYKTDNKMDILGDLPADIRRKLALPVSSPEQLLEIANRYCAVRSDRIFKVNQIHEYNWLSQENLDKCVERLKLRLPAACTMEIGYTMEFCGKTITGFIDVMDDNSIWEIKCVKELGPEHVLQLVMYALMHSVHTGKTVNYFLYNVINDELKQIFVESQNMVEIAKLLLHNKYHAKKTHTDEEFIAKAAKIRGETIEIAPDDACNQCVDGEPVVRKIELARPVPRVRRARAPGAKRNRRAKSAQK